MKKLLIIGCGPKATAIAAKAHILKELGWHVPEIVIIDRHGPIANWDGSSGYTDGDTILGSSPLEDVGFPYDSIIDKSVDKETLKFSYISYLIDIGKYTEWVDRNLTPPTHAMHADYFKWVIRKVDAKVILGEVKAIATKDNQWSIEIDNNGTTDELLGDGLIITGPGEPFEFKIKGTVADEKKVFNGKNFWQNIHKFKDLQKSKIAVIGAGETSAGIVVGLHSTLDKSSEIEIITKHPILLTRNEHWMEIMYFSKVMNWAELSEAEKKEIISHSDRGVYSLATMQLLDSAYNVHTALGNVKHIEVAGDKHYVVVEDKGEKLLGPYDYVVQATGFDPYSFVGLFSDPEILGTPHELPNRIVADLSVDDLPLKLHLPMLAAMAQGPGFPNLSCLGLLAERVLLSYIKKPTS